MSFTQTLMQQVAPLRASLASLPFVRGLAQGTLPTPLFQAYLIQDALYLQAYAQALTLAAARADRPEDAAFLGRMAQETVAMEAAMQTTFLQALPERQAAAPPTAERTPVCQAYSDFILARTALDPFAVGLAALLPCFCLYHEVGAGIAAAAQPDNPYRAWITTYQDPAFAEATDAAVALTDRAAQCATPPVREAMAAAFTQAARYEWLFWDAAGRQPRWPV